MKIKRIQLTYFLVIFSINAFSQGIIFEKNSFNEALKKAKQENKMLFVDVYTNWCGPCKLLARDVFPQKKVGDYFNEKFINYKLNLGTEEGAVVNKRYHIKIVPTLLFLDGDGNVKHKRVGNPGVDGLIAEAEMALNPEKRIEVYHKRFKDGERDIDFLAYYIDRLYKIEDKDKIAIVANEYKSIYPLKELHNKKAFSILYIGGVGYKDKFYNYLITNKADFVDLAGQKKVDRIIEKAIRKYYNAIIDEGSIDKLKEVFNETQKDLILPDQKKTEKYCIEKFYYVHKEFEKWFAIHDKDIEEALKTDTAEAWNNLINAAYTVSQDSVFYDDQKSLIQAIEYAKRANNLNKQFIDGYYCLTYLYSALGNKEAALESADAGIKRSRSIGNSGAIKMLQMAKEEIEAIKD